MQDLVLHGLCFGGHGLEACGEFGGALLVVFGGELDVDFWGDEWVCEAGGFAG